MNRNSKKPPKEDDPDKYVVPAVDRAARILLMLGAEAREMTLAEIVSATGWHKSSVHKILVTLCRHEFLDRDERTKRYSLGIALARCGQSVLHHRHSHQAAKSFLKELADYSGETANLAILHRTNMVIVDVMESPVELHVSAPIGTTDPMTAKSNGKAMLAWLPESKIRAILETEGLPARTRKSITNTKLYLRELAAVRKQGYATDFEEFHEGISAVSAPVFDSEGQAIGTLSVIGPAFRMTREKMHRYGKMCAKLAAQLSLRIR